MSCQPLANRVIAEALRPVTDAINQRLQQFAREANALFGTGGMVVHTQTPVQVPAAFAQVIARKAGETVGSLVAPFIPTAVRQKAAEAQAALAAAWLAADPPHRSALERDVEHCISHILTDLVSGKLLSQAMKR
jgi:hypothetical protein